VSGTNGHAPGLEGVVGTFDFQKWRRLTERALEEGERRYAAARAHLEEAEWALAQRLAELDVLRRALELEPITRRAVGAPAPLGKGARPTTPEEGQGQGPGFRASVYILETVVQRYRHSGVATFSARTVTLACRGWPETTIAGGLRRLRKDGLVVRTSRGQYELTEAGKQAPPAPARLLPLMAPREREEVARS
jgi:hypothetical protein